LTHCLELVR